MDADPTPPPAPGSSVNFSGITTVTARDIAGRDINYHIKNEFFTDPIQARNRRDMLELVTNTWIKGVLEQSLYNQVFIELGLQTQPGAVERSWDVHLQMPEQQTLSLPPGTPIIEVFDKCNGALLILGAPGSGKTTMLLQLARDLIARAEQDPLMRIPVVFNLSSWSVSQAPIPDWLISELRSQYQVSSKLAQAWVEQDALLLLLDGLDEVKSEQRANCVKVINTFRGDHGMMPLVVCSRIADYQALKTRLNLRGAVLLQPLTPAQIDGHLARAGPELTTVRQTLTQDTVLQELVQQPLMLNIMTLTYRGVPVAELGSERLGTLEARRKYLLDKYIEKMFKRGDSRSKNESHTSAQTTHWLTWLAQQMLEREQAIFYLESLHRSWLPTPTQRRLAAILVGLIFGLVLGLVVGMVAGLVWRVVLGGVLGVVLGVGVALLAPLYEEPAERLNWQWEDARSGLVYGLASGMSGGLVVGIIGGLASEMSGGQLGGLVSRLVYWLFSGLILGLVLGVVAGLVLGLVQGLKASTIETKNSPNQGYRQSLKNGIVVGLFAGLVFGLVGGLLGGLLGFLIGGLVLGLVFGLFIGFHYGGFAVINHCVARFFLSRNNAMPLNYVRFLDYASERIFLRKVGGGYIFIHRMLMEHFAAMESPKS